MTLLWWRLPRARRCLVHFRDPHAASLQGVLWRQRGPWLVLRQAEQIDGAGRAPLPLDGEVLIHIGEVLFLQLP